jgi:hypothetical protein
MAQFEILRAIALQQHMSEEFPTWLLAEVIAIADAPDLYADKVLLVELLISQISNFDPYAGVGCFDTSTSAETIWSTIRQIST